jgi:hypothetical protein
MYPELELELGSEGASDEAFSRMSGSLQATPTVRTMLYTVYGVRKT